MWQSARMRDSVLLPEYNVLCHAHPPTKERRTLGTTPSSNLGKLVNRVPEVTLVFWILKILATTVGETAADVLSTTFKLGTVVTSYVMAFFLLISLVFQLRQDGTCRRSTGRRSCSHFRWALPREISCPSVSVWATRSRRSCSPRRLP